MAKKIYRMLSLTAASGVMLQFGGCSLGELFGDGFFTDLTRSAIFELIWDSDAVFDFFGDSGPGLLL